MGRQKKQTAGRSAQTLLKHTTVRPNPGSPSSSATGKLPPPALRCHGSNQEAAEFWNLPPPALDHATPAGIPANVPCCLSPPMKVTNRLWEGQMPPRAWWSSEAAKAWPLPQLCLLNLRESPWWVKPEEAGLPGT